MTIRTVAGTAIQAAIDACAATGDVVDVKAGGYAGFTIPAGKKVEVNGNGSAVVSGPGNTVQVKGAGSTLRGLDVSGSTGQYNSCVFVNVPDVTLDHVVLHDGDCYGVRAYGALAVRLNMISPLLHHLAAGVEFHQGGAGSFVRDPVIHDMDRMVVNDPAGGNDTGGMALAFFKTNGLVTVLNPTIDRAYSVVRNGLPASYDYGWDGAAFELYACQDVLVDGGTIHGTPWIVETGKGSLDPDCSGFTMRNTKVGGQWPGAVPTATEFGRTFQRANGGFLLRSALNFVIEDCEFRDLDWHTILAEEVGGYTGKVANVVFHRNRVWLKTGTRLVTLGTGVAAAALTIDDNQVYPAPGIAAVASVLGHGTTNDKATLTGWTGWESRSYWGPEVVIPAETPLQAAIRERDAALASLATANATVAADDAKVLALTAARDTAQAAAASAQGRLAQAKTIVAAAAGQVATV